MLKRLWRIAEALRATWEWLGLVATLLGVFGVTHVLLGIYEGQPWSVIALYAVAAVAFWIVIATEGRALIGERKRRRIERLMALRTEGVQIMNRQVQANNVNAVILHQQAVLDWDKRVESALKEVGVPTSDIGWFTTLGTFTPRFIPIVGLHLSPGSQGPGSLSPVYLQYQNILAEKLDRLMEITRRLEDRK